MSFLNKPIKSLQATIVSIQGIESMPWYNPLSYPDAIPVSKDFRWRVSLDIDSQPQSAYNTRYPGFYTGQDIAVGDWIANSSSGQAWQIISIESKSDNAVTCIVQDIYRYNTFRDTSGTGNGAPNFGIYVIFNVGETGIPEIDPVPPGGISTTFSINLQSRFQYINLQFDYPLYQDGNTFEYNDVIAVDPVTHSFVLADAEHRLVIGRVTSVSDTRPGWFTINPTKKVVDYLNYLPGDVGDTIYTDPNEPENLTTSPVGPQLYIKLRNNTSSVSYTAFTDPATTAGSAFSINNTHVSVGGTGSTSDIISAINNVSNLTGVTASLSAAQTSVSTQTTLIAPSYGEPALYAANNYAQATINGVLVEFSITSATPGYEEYARPQQMAESINAANIENIVASTGSNGTVLIITNTVGGPIDIINIVSDINGVNFAGTDSGSGLALTTPSSTSHYIKFVAVDSRPIGFMDVIGTPVKDIGLISVENGVKACGLYIEDGIRNASSTVVPNITQLHMLVPMIGDQAYVIDSDDGNGNNRQEWSQWLYDGVHWIKIATQDSANTDAKSIEYTLNFSSAENIELGIISTGRRVTLITVEVTDAFTGSPSLQIGYQINTDVPSPPVYDGLMPTELIDLTTVGTYSTYTDLLFGVDTSSGDVTVLAKYIVNDSTHGSARIIVSYV